jgi:hypothetical protein
MKRREFLMGTAGIAVLTRAGLTGAGLRRQRARKIGVDRIAMMTLNFTNLLKTPWQPPSPERTLDLFDLPQMYADTYGVHNIELQHYHMASTEP